MKILHIYGLISVYTSLTALCFIRQQTKLSKQGRRSAGVAVLMHKTVMSFVTSIECEHDSINCFKLAKDAVGSDRDLLIICVFLPPYLSPYYRQTVTNCHIHSSEEFLLSLYERGGSSNCLIIDDLIARIGHWNNAEDGSDFTDNEEIT